MVTKDELCRLRQKELLMTALEESIDQLRSRLEKCTQNTKEVNVQSTPSASSWQDAACRMMDMQKKHSAMWDDYIDERDRIQTEILKLPTCLSVVVVKKYFSGRTLEQISDELQKDMRTITRYLNQAHCILARGY